MNTNDGGSNSAAYLRTLYKPGTRVVVLKMDDPYPVEPGTQGSVDHVDDAGTIHCRFDDGRYLGLIPEVDRFEIVN